MSWVTSTMVRGAFAWRSSSSRCSRLRTIGSTAPNGSSIRSTGGSAANARATPTRCCWPPESSAGYRRSRSRSSPTRSTSSATRAAGATLVPTEQAGDRRDVLRDRAMREQADLLDHVADPEAELVRRLGPNIGAVDRDRPGRGFDEPVDHAQGRGLAAARGADEHDDLAARYLQVEGRHGRSRRSGEGLGHALEGDRPRALNAGPRGPPRAAARWCADPPRSTRSPDVRCERSWVRAHPWVLMAASLPAAPRYARRP